MIQETTTFPSGRRGERCAAWVTSPDDGDGPHPTVVLVHGGGAVHDMQLPGYESAFAAAGFATVAFDYRHFGDSDGEPRQVMSVRRQLEDVEAALAFVKGRSDLDAARTALWGTSFGANHVLTVAARRPDAVTAAVVQCPIVRGRAVATASGLANVVRLTPAIVGDVLAAATHTRRRYVPIAARPGERGFVNRPGAHDGWHSVVPPDGSTFENRVTAASALGILVYDASRRAKDIRCPLLVCISEREELIDVGLVERVAADAPKGEVRRYDADHFDVYFPPLRDRIVADQLGFLGRHLVSEAGGDGERHGRALALVDPDVAAVGVHQAAGDRQP
jgi:pimeloyl-ACP methyl ester carboxylesterase